MVGRVRTVRSRTNNTNAIGDEEEDKPYTVNKEAEMRYHVLQTLFEASVRRKTSNARSALYNMNRGLIHMLEIIEKAPNGKITTRELLKTIKSYNMHKLLKEAQILGFVKRTPEKTPKGMKGGTRIVNSLTEEGRFLLQELADEKYFDTH
jgi:hypothetical protein